jgi:hypothetical protein
MMSIKQTARQFTILKLCTVVINSTLISKSLSS